MKYNKASKLLAEEAWRMITDECKEKMISLKEHYIQSLSEDIRHFFNSKRLDDTNNFIDSLDNETINKIRNSKSDAEVRRILKTKI
jgi:glutamyl-tRNA reductase